MKQKEAVVRVARVILRLFFVMDGVIKLTGISKTVQLFGRIGWGQWFRYLTGGRVHGCMPSTCTVTHRYRPQLPCSP